MSTPETPDTGNFENNPAAAPVQPDQPATKSIADAAPASAPGWERATLEKLAFAALEEQKTQRRWKLYTRLAWFALILITVWAVALRTPSADKSKPHTAVVEIRGEIAAGTEAGAEAIVAALRSAFEDEGARAIVLLINSPGGSPVQAGIINDEIRRLKAIHKKPVYAVVEEMCASAAYYIAVAADTIYVDKASIVGSIGVLMDGFGFTGLMEKLGVERRLMTAGENKFIDVVKKGRGKRLKETPETFSGLFWSGQQAVENGLVDKFGNLDYVAREVVKAEDLVDYTRRENVAERLAKRFGAAVGEGAVRAMKSAPSLR